MNSNKVFKDVDWVQENFDKQQVILLDATIPKVGQSAEDVNQVVGIPGARWMDLKVDFTEKDALFPNTMPAPSHFQKSARALGINNDDIIIVYDRHGIYSSPRAWWLFKIMGHEHVFILNGGLPAWIGKGWEKEPLTLSGWKIGDFDVDYQEGLMQDYKYVLSKINEEDTQIIDARSSGRFTAKDPEPRIGMRGGHIPSSSNIPIKDLMEKGRIKDSEELRKVFDQASAADKELIFTCGSGVTACVLAAAAEEAGYNKIKVFDGSWTEWASREELPVEK